MPTLGTALDAILVKLHREADLPTQLMDPDSTLDFTVDFTDWLDDVETPSVAVTVDAPLQVTTPAPAFSGKLATAWIVATGATPGRKYLVRFRVTTDAGRATDRSFWILIKSR